jgi:NTP pyrophosphatase (non-canonical NTP hydrolase)
MKNLNELAQNIHESNKLRGFDVAQDNIGQSLMLIIGEISEAIDAHQCGRYANQRTVNCICESTEYIDFTVFFDEDIKNTFEDELADIVIRTLDFCAAFCVDIEKLCYDNETNILSANIGEYFLVLTGQVHGVFLDIENKEENCYGKLGSVITAVEYKAKELNIDIEKHIELKMRYNETRSYKHGKLY